MMPSKYAVLSLQGVMFSQLWSYTVVYSTGRDWNFHVIRPCWKLFFICEITRQVTEKIQKNKQQKLERRLDLMGIGYMLLILVCQWEPVVLYKVIVVIIMLLIFLLTTLIYYYCELGMGRGHTTITKGTPSLTPQWSSQAPTQTKLNWKMLSVVYIHKGHLQLFIAVAFHYIHMWKILCSIFHMLMSWLTHTHTPLHMLNANEKCLCDSYGGLGRVFFFHSHLFMFTKSLNNVFQAVFLSSKRA